MTAQTTALRIRLLRSLAKMTQEALAEKIGANRVTVSHYESGAYNPSHSVILKLADIFDVSADYLLGRTDDPRRTPNLKMEKNGFSEYHEFNETIFRRPGMRILFDAAKDAPDDVLQKTADLLEVMKNGHQK